MKTSQCYIKKYKIFLETHSKDWFQIHKIFKKLKKKNEKYEDTLCMYFEMCMLLKSNQIFTQPKTPRCLLYHLFLTYVFFLPLSYSVFHSFWKKGWRKARARIKLKNFSYIFLYGGQTFTVVEVTNFSPAPSIIIF